MHRMQILKRINIAMKYGVPFKLECPDPETAVLIFPEGKPIREIAKDFPTAFSYDDKTIVVLHITPSTEEETNDN